LATNLIELFGEVEAAHDTGEPVCLPWRDQRLTDGACELCRRIDAGRHLLPEVVQAARDRLRQRQSGRPDEQQALDPFCPRLGPDELEQALAILAATPTKRVAAKFDIDVGRIRTLAAGIVLLTALQARLGTPLRVVRGGLREGALADLAARCAAAAA
jgi:hypothetical protein